MSRSRAIDLHAVLLFSIELSGHDAEKCARFSASCSNCFQKAAGRRSVPAGDQIAFPMGNIMLYIEKTTGL
ncbi:hypothetical protein ELI07_21105 [Rhizobium leguminosarum]|nr:hypothetical protein ELI40_20090 [Rhizobium leguminosarum]TAX11845.1 hypothetical protein ELI07_21105 [Rhizobium leguminosarum]TAY11946.1 hypothetical protein ELH96_09405 [Rhizobium leguminosarum]TAZ15942.1 hypothetical protein ELH81_18585 [Rhizobium leguminosarum]